MRICSWRVWCHFGVALVILPLILAERAHFERMDIC